MMTLKIQESTVTLAGWRVKQLADLIRENRPDDERGVWAEEDNVEVLVCQLSTEQRQSILDAAK